MKIDSISIFVTTVVYLFSILLSGTCDAWPYNLLNHCECNINEDCADNKMCIQNKCVNLCEHNSPCGVYTECSIISHTLVCNCLPGMIGYPYTTGCTRPNSYPCCDTNADCPNYEMCHENKCVDACNQSPPCGSNTNCFKDEHKCLCECLPDFNGDPYNHGCKKIYSVPHCDNHKECADDQICAEGKCVNACGPKSLCGPNTTCTAKNNFGICKCKPGLTGNPYGRGCSKPVHGCWSSQDCRDNETCLNGKCILGCHEQPPCGYNTTCETIDHIRECKCYPGYEGDAYGDGCTIRAAYPCCHNNADCANYETCVKTKCVNTCKHESVCGYNTTCSAINHSSICKCLPGQIGDPYGDGCKSLNPCPNCLVDTECEDDEICVDNKCVDACEDFHQSLCGPNSFCTTKNHVSNCLCTYGFSGDPYGDGCVKSPRVPDCCDDTNCRHNEICIDGKCITVCNIPFCI